MVIDDDKLPEDDDDDEGVDDDDEDDDEGASAVLRRCLVRFRALPAAVVVVDEDVEVLLGWDEPILVDDPLR